MSDEFSGSDRLTLRIRVACWAALFIIAGMAAASFMLLNEMLSAHQRTESLMELSNAQKTLSQRIVFLANAGEVADAQERAARADALQAAVTEFERNHDRLVATIGGAVGPAQEESDVLAVRDLLYGEPHHLDFFTSSLAANGWRLATALGAQNFEGADIRREGARDMLNETVANATLQGYSALTDILQERSGTLLSRLLDTHRVLFMATIGVICLVGLFILMPMTEIIRRRTTDLVEARNSMAHLAVHDGLTGLHNRAFMRDHFDQLIKTAHRRKERLAVIQFDLDRFKQINDTLGHAVGDHVLITTAERMRGACRASDVCARLGGDEFVMVMPAAGSSENIDGLARRILDRINEPIVHEGVTIFSGASAGIAVYPVDADNGADLLVHADLALYAAKKQGGGSFSFFSDELRRELEHRKQLERDIAEAIESEAFEVYFQPQVSLIDGQITGVEALLRWRHEERGMIPPGEFIPIAEKSGDMPAIGRIVMRKAIAEAARWHRSGLQFGRLAINASGTELREPDFTRFLFDTLQAAGLPPQRLSLEIVESVILDDEKTGIAARLRMIRAAGIHLELDDFGTGYASLSHVNPNEIDRLKIDRRFVQNINLNDDNCKIVRAITELARGLGISIIAEGAETEEELSSLLDIGCEQVQGYSIAFPMPQAQAREWLEARAPRKAVLAVVAGTGT